MGRDVGITGGAGAIAPVAFCIHNFMGAVRVHKSFKTSRFFRNRILM